MEGSPKVKDLSLVPTYDFAPALPDVIVLMSGGVDSSLAAWLLKRDGWRVAGVTMDHLASPSSEGASLAARALAFPHYSVDLRKAFAQEIVEPFVRGYSEGITPNPCAECNGRFKFGLLWEAIERFFGPVIVASGHYARVEDCGGEYFLARAADRAKDQSYFLASVRRERLPRLLLPLGGMTKAETRALALSVGLGEAKARESMEICFAGEGDYRPLLDRAVGTPGAIVDESGRLLGEHKGIGGYTVGQRKGLGVAAPEGLYVLRLDRRENRVVVGSRERVLRSLVRSHRVNVLIPGGMTTGSAVFAKLRSKGEPAPCVVTAYNEEEGRLEVEFAEPQFAPTPGQCLVAYTGDGRVIAGGIIVREEGDIWTEEYQKSS